MKLREGIKNISNISNSTKSSNNNTIGFDPDSVRFTLKKLQNTYNDLVYQFINYTNTFLNNISITWACPEAVDYFRNIFCPAFNSFIIKIDTSFENIFNTINLSATKWATKTDASYNKVSFVRFQHKSIDASQIKDNINGSLGINPEETINTLSNLDNINDMINEYLRKSINILRTSKFVGAGQQQALIQSATSIKNSISDSFINITVSIKNKVKETKEKYLETSSKVSSDFSSLK